MCIGTIFGPQNSRPRSVLALPKVRLFVYNNQLGSLLYFWREAHKITALIIQIFKKANGDGICCPKPQTNQQKEKKILIVKIAYGICLYWAVFFFHLIYFCCYLWVLLHFLVLFMSPTVLFKITFKFIYRTFSKKISISVK